MGALWSAPSRAPPSRSPLWWGKPSSFMLDDVAQRFGLDKSEICMIGDRLDTDILFGQNGGLKTLLVLTGVTTEERLQSPENEIQPDLYAGGLKDLRRPPRSR